MGKGGVRERRGHGRKTPTTAQPSGEDAFVKWGVPGALRTLPPRSPEYHELGTFGDVGGETGEGMDPKDGLVQIVEEIDAQFLGRRHQRLKGIPGRNALSCPGL